jgi:ribosomal protein S18 acetylase RimI-like enzyme
MQHALSHPRSDEVTIRSARAEDVEALLAIEQQVFSTDLLSRRSFHRYLTVPSAAVVVAAHADAAIGYAIVLFRRGSPIARLYSIAVAPHLAGRRIGATLLSAAEEAALGRDCAVLRLEVREDNGAAIARYQKSGYRPFGRFRAYYEDGAPALRFEKALRAADPPTPRRRLAERRRPAARRFL